MRSLVYCNIRHSRWITSKTILGMLSQFWRAFLFSNFCKCKISSNHTKNEHQVAHIHAFDCGKYWGYKLKDGFKKCTGNLLHSFCAALYCLMLKSLLLHLLNDAVLRQSFLHKLTANDLKCKFDPVFLIVI